MNYILVGVLSFIITTFSSCVKANPEKLGIFNNDATPNDNYINSQEGYNFKYKPRYSNPNVNAYGAGLGNRQANQYDGEYKTGFGGKYKNDFGNDFGNGYGINYKYGSELIQQSYPVTLPQPVAILIPQVIPISHLHSGAASPVYPVFAPHHVSFGEPQTTLIDVPQPIYSQRGQTQEYYGPGGYDVYENGFGIGKSGFYGYPRKHKYNEYGIGDITGLYENNRGGYVGQNLKYKH